MIEVFTLLMSSRISSFMFFLPLFKDKIVLIRTDVKDNLEEGMLKVQENRDFKRENRIGKI